MVLSPRLLAFPRQRDVLAPEPQQHLTRAAQFDHLRERQREHLLDPPIRILLDPALVRINGLRNRDLQLHLHGPTDPHCPLSQKEKRRRSAAVSRKLRLLRAHGLIQEVPKAHRYQVTAQGRLAITAILTMDRTSIALLNKAAA
jgi:hypothetical protein